MVVTPKMSFGTVAPCYHLFNDPANEPDGFLMDKAVYWTLERGHSLFLANPCGKTGCFKYYGH